MRENQERYLRWQLNDLENKISALGRNLLEEPWGDPRREEALAAYEAQRQMVKADYAALQ